MQAPMCGVKAAGIQAQLFEVTDSYQNARKSKVASSKLQCAFMLLQYCCCETLAWHLARDTAYKQACESQIAMPHSLVEGC